MGRQATLRGVDGAALRSGTEAAASVSCMPVARGRGDQGSVCERGKGGGLADLAWPWGLELSALHCTLPACDRVHVPLLLGVERMLMQIVPTALLPSFPLLLLDAAEGQCLVGHVRL